MTLKTSDKVFLALALVSGGLCFALGGLEAVANAMATAASLLLSILPQLAAGLLIGGLVQQLFSQEQVARVLGEKSGFRGLVLATGVGAITPGGPFTSFPLVHALWVAGADAGALISFLTAWSLIGVNRLIVWELPLMGTEFSLVRTLVCLPLPIAVGLLARWLARSPRLALRKAPTL